MALGLGTRVNLVIYLINVEARLVTLPGPRFESLKLLRWEPLGGKARVRWGQCGRRRREAAWWPCANHQDEDE